MDRQEKVNVLVETFLDKDYGETVEHFKIASLINEGVTTSEYRYIVRKASKKLLDCGKMIENVRGVGYRVVNPDDYTMQSAKCIVSGSRRVNKGAKILTNAPVGDMSDEGRRQYNVIADRVKILQAAVAGARVEINMLSNKRANPLRLMAESKEKAERSAVRRLW